MKDFWLKTFQTSAARFYGLIISTISLILIARFLGPEGQGTIAAAITWVSFFATFAGLSLGHVAQYRIQSEQEENFIPVILKTLLFMVVTLSLLAYIVTYFLYSLTDSELFHDLPVDILLISFACLPFYIWEQYSSNLLAAVGKLKSYNISQILGRTFWILGILSLIFFAEINVLRVLVVNFIALFLTASICLYAFRNDIKGNFYPNTNEIKELLKGSLKLHLTTIASFLLMQISILTLNYYCSKAEVGWYQLASQMMISILIIPQAISLVFFSYIPKVGIDRFWETQKQLMLITCFLVSIIIMAAYYAAPYIIPILVGKEFIPSVPIFRLLLPAAFGQTLAILMTCQWISRGLFIHTTIVTIISGLLNLIINIIVVKKYGIWGAALTTFFFLGIITSLVQLFFAFWCNKISKRNLSTNKSQ